MAWDTSTRRARLPRDWGTRVAATRRRAGGRCEATQHEPTCDGIGTECDHIVRGDDHSLTNLQWLSEPCHAAKTQREALEAYRAKRAGLKLPREEHPTRTGARIGRGEAPRARPPEYRTG